MIYLLLAMAVTAVIGMHFASKHQTQDFNHLLDKLRRENEELAKQSDEAAAQSRTLFDSLPVGLALLDPRGRIQLYSAELQRLFNTRDELRGRTLLEAFQRHELAELAQRSTREPQSLELQIGLRGADQRLFHVTAAPVSTKDGGQGGLIILFDDLTRLKQLENTRQEFVANVSHELRTPLSLIQGYVETLLNGAKDDPEIALRFLQTIAKHADRLTFLIEDLLTISALESGRIVMNFQTVPLCEIVARVQEDLKIRASDKGVTILNAVSPELILRADSDRLQQVLFNLVENAIKYGSPKGKIEIGATVSGKICNCWVRDDGPGIPAESLERVFERFYRVDKARSRETGGTGLGLSIVKHIIQAHEGEVRVESEPGNGTTFHFSLPLAEPGSGFDKV